MGLEFQTADRVERIPDSFLLVGIDDTGHEHPSNPAHPVFGLGGCAVPVAKYGQWIRTPWSGLKKAHFGSESVGLHATEIDPSNLAAVQALGEFFRTGQFGRIAVLTSVDTSFSEPIPDYKLVARLVIERIARLVGHFGCDGAVLVHEEGQRTDHLAATFFDGYSLTRDHAGQPRNLPFKKFRMPKSANEPFLEVADFVIQAAGGQVRTSLKGRRWGCRPDFQAVFTSVDPALVEFIDVTTVQMKPR
jgi:hypothetical protein